MPTQTARPLSAARTDVLSINRECSGSVALARSQDLAYVVHLQKKFGQAIGFLPRAALSEKIELQRIWIARENGQPAGYLHHGTLATPEVRIFQAAIQYDARRRRLAAGLVEHFVCRAQAAGAYGVSLRCLAHLDANEFWEAVGFRRIASEPGAKGRLNVWTRDLRRHPSADEFTFASRLHPCPGCGDMSVDTWTRGGIRHRSCPACCAARLNRSVG